MTVANVHIAYDKFVRQDKQCLQVGIYKVSLKSQIYHPSNSMISLKIAATVRKLQQMCKEGEGQIICGDFNSWPSSPPQQLLNDGTLNEENLSILRNIFSVVNGNEVLHKALYITSDFGPIC